MGYNDDGAENGSNIYEAEVCTQELEWSGFLGGGGGGGYHCGGVSMGLYLGWRAGQRGLFCFCRSHLTNDGGFLHFRCEERHDDNNNDAVGYFAN